MTMDYNREEDYKPDTDGIKKESAVREEDEKDASPQDANPEQPVEKEAVSESEEMDAGHERKLGDAVKKILSAVEWLLLAVSFGLVIYAFACTARGKAVSVAGYSLLHVITGSMEPTISVGEYVIVKREEMSALQVGDIVAYYTKDPQIYGKPVIHRILEMNDDGTFVTKGDANPVPDPIKVYPDQILGRYVRRSFIFNWLASFADPRKLLLLLVSIPIFLISIYEAGTLAKLIKIKRSIIPGPRQETKEEAVERLKKQAIEEFLAKKDDNGSDVPVSEEKDEPGTEDMKVSLGKPETEGHKQE